VAIKDGTRGENTQGYRQFREPYLPEITALVSSGRSHPQVSRLPSMSFANGPPSAGQRHDLTGTVSYTSYKRFIRAHNIEIDPARSTCRPPWADRLRSLSHTE